MNPLRLVLIILSGGVGGLGLLWLLLRQFGWWSVSLVLGVTVFLLVFGLVKRAFQKRQKKKTASDDQSTSREIARQSSRVREKQICSALDSMFHLLRSRYHAEAYRLPIYLMIGPEGAGKSSLLKSFGLLRVRTTELEQAEEYLQVWCSENLVVIKLWGRLYEQPDGSHDEFLWLQALRRLLRERPRRALNGILVALPVTILTEQAGETREQQVDTLRRRLHETAQMLGQILPTYLTVTQCDRLVGFAGAFNKAFSGEVEQCFGALTDGAYINRRYSREWFEKSWESLRSRVQNRISLALHEETEQGYRVDIVILSWQLQLLGPRLDELLGSVFRHYPLGAAVCLRGYFLTGHGGEAPREDLLLRYLCKRYGFSGGSERPSASNALNYFSRGLVPSVLLPEAGLASTNRQKVWLWRILCSSWLLCCLTLVIVSGVWMYSNINYMDHQGQVMLNAWRQLQVSSSRQSDFVSQIIWFQSLNNVIAEYEKPAPWYIVFSLMKHGAGRQLYLVWRNQLLEILQPILLRKLEDAVRLAQYEKRPERMVLFAQLYFALTGEYSLQPDTDTRFAIVQELLGDDAEQRKLVEAFGHQLDVMIANPGSASARRAEFLELLKTAWLKAGDSFVLLNNMADILGFRNVPVSQVFSSTFLDTFRLEPALIQSGFPSRFGRRAADRMDFDPDSIITRLFINTRRVLFHPQFKQVHEVERRQVLHAARTFYFNGYAEFWQKLLSTVQLRPIQSKEQLAKVLLNLSSSVNSPLAALVNAVVYNTQFGTGRGEIDEGEREPESSLPARGALQNIVARSGQKVSALTPTGPLQDQHLQDQKEELSAQFAMYLQQLSPNEQEGISAVTARFAQLLDILRPALFGVDSDSQALSLMSELSEGTNDFFTDLEAEVETLPENLRRLMKDLINSTLTILLKSAAREIDRHWQRDVMPLWRSTMVGYYPANSSSDKDADPAALENLLAMGGVIDRYVNNYLRPFSSVSGTEVRPRPVKGFMLPLNNHVWSQVSTLSAIRKILFAKDNKVSMDMTLRMVTMSPTVTLARLESDSGVLTGRHGPSQWQPFHWDGSGTSDSLLSMSCYSDDLLLAEQEWRGPWRWLRWLQSGTARALGRGEFSLIFHIREYQLEMVAHLPGETRVGVLFNRLQLPDQLL